MRCTAYSVLTWTALELQWNCSFRCAIGCLVRCIFNNLCEKLMPTQMPNMIRNRNMKPVQKHTPFPTTSMKIASLHNFVQLWKVWQPSQYQNKLTGNWEVPRQTSIYLIENNFIFMYCAHSPHRGRCHKFYMFIRACVNSTQIGITAYFLLQSKCHREYYWNWVRNFPSTTCPTHFIIRIWWNQKYIYVSKNSAVKVLSVQCFRN
jgi:hypothetical protein